MNIPLNEKLNELLQYIYVSLRSYPPEKVIVVEFPNTERYTGRFWFSIAKMLNMNTCDLMLSVSILSKEKPNLKLTQSDILQLYSQGIIPDVQVDVSTT